MRPLQLLLDMKERCCSKYILLLSAVLVALVFFCQLAGNWAEIMPAAEKASALPYQRPLLIGGLDLTNYSGEQPLSRIRIDRMEVRPRRFGSIRIKSLNEIFLKTLFLQVYYSPLAKDDTYSQPRLIQAFEESMKGIDSLKGLGRIQRAVIDDLHYQSLIESPGKILMSVRARHAIYEVKKNQLLLEHAQVNQPGHNRRLVASKLLWNEQKSRWQTIGRATLWQGSQQIKVDSVELDTQLNPIQQK